MPSSRSIFGSRRVPDGPVFTASSFGVTGHGEWQDVVDSQAEHVRKSEATDTTRA
jgi:hypothetical protein